MPKNKHFGMDLKKIWFKIGEFNKLVNAINCNQQDLAFEIIYKMNKRGDLQ